MNSLAHVASHFHAAFAGKGTNTNDRADVFLVVSTNGGTSWTSPVRVNGDATLNDQWMPVLAVRPDGTKLFLGWYDRRNDSNNSLIDFYGRFGTIASNGSVALGTEFKTSTTSFPPVFAGTLAANESIGQYDPLYPPEDVDLHWHYPEWPAGELTLPTYVGHVGEYDAAWSEGGSVHVVWTDNRRLFYSQAQGAVVPRNNRDIRLVRLSWPQ